MRHPQLLLISALMMTAFWAGCRGETRPAVFDSTVSYPVGQANPEDPWNALRLQAEQDARRRPKFIPVGKAKNCPQLTVSAFTGEKGKIDPGRKGSITLVVFWSMDFTFTRAAVRHVGDLVQKYADQGVRAIGIVENTKVAKSAPGFVRDEGMDYSAYCYLDDFSALRAMGKAARESGVEEVPCFFMIDRSQRVRFFKRGFSFVAASVTAPGESEGSLQQGEEVIENAPPGERIEDYLQKLLSER